MAILDLDTYRASQAIRLADQRFKDRLQEDDPANLWRKVRFAFKQAQVLADRAAAQCPVPAAVTGKSEVYTALHADIVLPAESETTPPLGVKLDLSRIQHTNETFISVNLEQIPSHTKHRLIFHRNPQDILQAQVIDTEGNHVNCTGKLRGHKYSGLSTQETGYKEVSLISNTPFSLSISPFFEPLANLVLRKPPLPRFGAAPGNLTLLPDLTLGM